MYLLISKVRVFVELDVRLELCRSLHSAATRRVTVHDLLLALFYTSDRISVHKKQTTNNNNLSSLLCFAVRGVRRSTLRVRRELRRSLGRVAQLRGKRSHLLHWNASYRYACWRVRTDEACRAMRCKRRILAQFALDVLPRRLPTQMLGVDTQRVAAEMRRLVVVARW